MNLLTVSAIASALAALLAAAGPGQQKGAAGPEWVEAVPEKKSLMDAKRLRKYEDGLVLEVVLVRDPNFFGKDVVHAQGFVSNPTKKKLTGAYYVATFDKDRRLIASGGLKMLGGVDPGEKNYNLSVVLEAPTAELDKIRFAQYRWYVAEPGPDDK